MPYTAAAKKFMLDALRGGSPTSPITHAGLLAKGADKTGTAAASTDLVTSTAHGFSAGDLVVFAALTGGTGLVVGRPYFVIAGGLTANVFAVSVSPGGTAVDITVDASALTVNKLTELSGGTPAYARKAIAFNAAVDPGTMDDSTNGAVFDVPLNADVDYVGFYSAITAGTLHGVDDVTHEHFAAQGTYTVTDVDLDLMAA